MHLGDAYFHNGSLYGMADADARALDAFKRALALDSLSATNPNAEYLMHFSELGLNAGDTGLVRRLLTLAAARDPTGKFAAQHAFSLAEASGDSAGLARLRAGFGRASFQVLIRVLWENQGRGVRVEDAQRAMDAAWTAPSDFSAGAPAPRHLVRVLAHDLALNRGRPRDALAVAERVDLHARGSPRDLITMPSTGVATPSPRRRRRGRSSRPSRVHGRRSPIPTSTPTTGTSAPSSSGGWRTRTCGRRPPRSPGSARRQRFERIQAPEEHQRCADLLDAWHATIARLPDARQRLARVDSLQRAYPVGVTELSDPGVEPDRLPASGQRMEIGRWPRPRHSAGSAECIRSSFRRTCSRKAGRPRWPVIARRPSGRCSITWLCATTPSPPSGRRSRRCGRSWRGWWGSRGPRWRPERLCSSAVTERPGGDEWNVQSAAEES